MAPEILTGTGYTYTVDLWSIGICLYEFLYGNVPFAEDIEDPYEVYEEVIHGAICFPGFSNDKTTIRFIN